MRTPFLYVEARSEQQLLPTGSCRHELVDAPGGLKIRGKRVDLVNVEAALPAVQLFI